MDYKFIKAVYPFATRHPNTHPFGQPLDAATEFVGPHAQSQICTTPLYFQYVPLTPHQFKTPPSGPDPLRLTGKSVVPNIDPLVEKYDFDVLAIFGMAPRTEHFFGRGVNRHAIADMILLLEPAAGMVPTRGPDIDPVALVPSSRPKGAFV